MGSYVMQWTGSAEVSWPSNNFFFLQTTMVSGTCDPTEKLTRSVMSITAQMIDAGDTLPVIVSLGVFQHVNINASGTFTHTYDADAMVTQPWGQAVSVDLHSSWGDRAHYIITDVTFTVTTTAVSNPGPPPPPPPGGGGGGIPPPPEVTPVKFVHNGQERVQYDTNYALEIVVRDSAGIRDLFAQGVIAVAVTTSANPTQTTAATAFTINGGASLSNFVTITDGRGTCTLRFPSGASALPPSTPIYLHALTSGTAGLSFTPGANHSIPSLAMSGSPMQLAAPGLAFTVQPPTASEVGATFVTPVQVSALTSGGTVNTSWASDIVLTMKALDGTDATTLLGGVKTQTPVAGVSTFPGLFISKVGFYVLYATSTAGTLTLTGISTGILVVGDDGEQTLRQNLRDDSTVWVKTTNITSPTYATFSTDDKSLLDGDEAVASNLTFDGARWCFAYTLKVAMARFKVKLSTLASAPIISLYTSQDTTTGQDGTWTLQTSMTPTTTDVFIAQFLTGTLYAKGVWLTLNDNGGAAAASWYSMQLMGKYLGAPISYIASDIDQEVYVTIPAPLVTLSGTQTKTRSLQLRNNTAASMQLSVISSAARYTGDALMTDHIALLNSDGTALDPFTLLAYASKLIVLRYTILAADNDNSADHYARISVYPGGLPVTSLVVADSSGGVGCGARYINADTGANYVSTSYGGTVSKSLTVFLTTNALLLAGASTTALLSRLPLVGHTFGTAATYNITGWAGGQETHLSGVGVIDDRMLMSLDNSTTVLYPSVSAASFVTVSVNRSTLLSFTLPAQTTGAKYFAAGPAGSIFVQNGTAANSVVYRISASGYVLATLDPTVPFGGRGIRCVYWDSSRSEVYIASSVSAGSRVMSRYTKDGVLIASVSTTTQSGSEADGMYIAGLYLYIMYGGRYLYHHDIQTLANATSVFSLGAGSIFTPGTVSVGV